MNPYRYGSSLHLAYCDAFHAGLFGRACPKHALDVYQQAYDRGFWDGCKDREQRAKVA